MTAEVAVSLATGPVEAYPEPRKVLVVDDEPAVLGLHRRMLQHAGVEVETARTLAEAADLLQHRRFWAVVTDMHLTDGGAEGLEIIRLARARAVGTHVIVVTGCNDFRVEAEAIRRGADHYLLKPFSLRRVIDLMAGLEP